MSHRLARAAAAVLLTLTLAACGSLPGGMTIDPNADLTPSGRGAF